MTAEESLPEELRGGYRRIAPTDVTVGTPAAVLYDDGDGRNVRKGPVQAVELTGRGLRLALVDEASRLVDRLLVVPASDDDGDGADGGDADGDDGRGHRVLVETPIRTRPLGTFEALYAADGE